MRVDVFNQQHVRHVPSTLRFDLLGPCRDLVTAARRLATWLSGGATARSGHGNIEWFEQKGEVALAGLLFAGAVGGAKTTDVFWWVQLDGHQQAIRVLAEHSLGGDEGSAEIGLEWQLQRVGGHPLTHKQHLEADGNTETIPLPPIGVSAVKSPCGTKIGRVPKNGPRRASAPIIGSVAVVGE